MMMTWRTMRTMLAMLAVVGLLVVSACGGGGSGESPAARKWHGAETLPAAFPDDVPVYPNATLEKAITSEGHGPEEGAYVAWYTDDKIPAVRHFYTTKLDELGWHVVSYPGVATSWLGDGGVTVVGTKWGRTVSFALGAKGKRTLIALVIPAKG